MRKFTMAAVVFGLAVSLAIPASAAAGLQMLAWVHTSGGMGEGNPATYPDTYAFAFSPNYAADHTMYAATYIGLYRSTDQGLTWTNKMASTLPAITSISISPADATGNSMIAGTEDGILQTSNRWDNASGLGPVGMAVPVAAYSPDYANDRMIYAGTDGYGVRAKNDGPTWWSLDEGNVLGKVTGIVFDPNYATNHILYVASYGYGVFKGDGGTDLSSWQWTALNAGLDSANQKFVNAIAISPNFTIDHTLLIAADSVGIYKSTDSGDHWTATSDVLAFQSLLFSPGYATDQTIYAGEGSNGVYRSMDGGANWNLINRGFADTVHPGAVLSLGMAPGKPTNFFAGFTGGNNGGVWQMLLPSSRLFVPLVKK